MKGRVLIIAGSDSGGGAGIIASCLGRADGGIGGVGALLNILQFGQRLAQRFVLAQQLGGPGRQGPARQTLVKAFRVLANPANVVHGVVLILTDAVAGLAQECLAPVI